MYINTSHTKGIFGTAIVQCDAACKWLQSGSGLVDAGPVDGCVNQPRDAPTIVKSSCRELQGTAGDNLTNVDPYLRLLYPCLLFGTITC